MRLCGLFVAFFIDITLMNNGKPIIQWTSLRPRRIRDRLFLQYGEPAIITGLIREKATIVTTDRYRTDKITEDPSDNKFLACALEAEADYIVSGDNHLLTLKHFHGIQIVDAKTFVEKIKGK